MKFEEDYYSDTVKYIVGVDEAGRGCLFGPVVAAAVILPPHFYTELINDSKKLNEKNREIAYQFIINNALDYGVGVVEADVIDKINILEATKLAMYKAINNLKHPFDLVLIDAVKLSDLKKESISLIKGDAKAECIAAASIIAKVSRDHLCYELDKKYPMYNIKNNKGYGTKDHLKALEEYGPIQGLHRFSYSPVKQSLIKKIKLF